MKWNLVCLRKEANISQKEMADLLDISLSTYWRKETGKKDFNETEMFKIRNILQKPIDEIFLQK